MSVKWYGPEALKKVKQRIAGNLTLVGEYGTSFAKMLCAVDTGNLRNSIDYEVNEKQLSVKIGTNVEYAPYLEFGTGEFAENGEGRKGGWFYKDEEGKTHFTFGNKPQPFLRPILDQKTQIQRLLNR